MDKYSNFEHDLIFKIASIKNENKTIYDRIHWSEVKMDVRLSVYLGYEIGVHNQLNLIFYLEKKFDINFSDNDMIILTDHKLLVKDLFSILRNYGIIDIQKERKDKLKKLDNYE